VAELTPAEEDAVLARSGIEIVVGGHPFKVAPLAIDRNRDFKRFLGARVGVVIGSISSSSEDWSKLVATVASMTEDHIALLVAYDEGYDADGTPTRPGKLGGVAYIESHASEREAWNGLKAVLDEAFPQLGELLRKVPPAVLIPTLLQLLESSTSSPSPAGPPSEAPRSSKPRSPRASSTS
jgi:hypothetical protein